MWNFARSKYRKVAGMLCITSLLLVFIQYSILSEELEEEEEEDPMPFYPDLSDLPVQNHGEERDWGMDHHVTNPIVLWWNGFGHIVGDHRQCGEHQCFITSNSAYRSHPKMKAFLFYGTDTNLKHMPLPRKPEHLWNLLHEESPKNNYIFSHRHVLELFNFTGTFKRNSHYPLTTQYLPSIDALSSRRWLRSTAEKRELALNETLAPILYVHSDCTVPSERDELVTELQRYIAVDSYGSCINNRKLPEDLRDPIKGMSNEKFYEISSKYKFAIAAENALCEDYITEKLWRPLELGVVPIVYGSRSVEDWLPNKNSAILVKDFKSVKDLANYILKLDKDDAAYEQYLRHKEPNGITNEMLKRVLNERKWSVDENQDYSLSFIYGFECYVCEQIHKNVKAQADHSHYGCPLPMHADPQNLTNMVVSYSWTAEFDASECRAHVFRRFSYASSSNTTPDIWMKEMNNCMANITAYRKKSNYQV